MEVEAIGGADVTIYIDASIEVLRRDFVEHCIENLQGDLLLLRHHARDCIYEEARVSRQFRKYHDEPIAEQVDHYARSIRRTTDCFRVVSWFDATRPRCASCRERGGTRTWKWSYQDQLSFPVVARATEIRCDHLPGHAFEEPASSRCTGTTTRSASRAEPDERTQARARDEW